MNIDNEDAIEIYGVTYVSKAGDTCEGCAFYVCSSYRSWCDVNWPIPEPLCLARSRKDGRSVILVKAND